jgi:cytochrome oxidase Cu insertion factor (SCO1/SenC/PrrC family)
MMKALIAGLAVVLVSAGVLVVVTGAALYQRSQAAAIVDSHPVSAPASQSSETGLLTEFTLTERSGRPFHSADLDGKVWVTSFFFASCPSACRSQNEQIKQLASDFGSRGVTFVSITCDPEIDTPDVLSRYADLFNADPQQWLFLTGDLTYIRRIAGEIFQLPLDKQTHSERLIVIDRSGQVRGRFHWNNPDQIAEMRRVLDQALSEPAPPAMEQEAATGEPQKQHASG